MVCEVKGPKRISLGTKSLRVHTSESHSCLELLREVTMKSSAEGFPTTFWIALRLIQMRDLR